MKASIAILLCTLLVACDSSASKSTVFSDTMQTVPELRGCNTFKISDGVAHIYVTRCPAVETVSTSTVGKNQKHVTTISDPMTPMDSDNTHTQVE